MSFKRKFEKFFNRSMPLLNIQYWYQGEHYGLPQITEQTIHFNPLFVYRENKGTDVYYDVNNPKTDDGLMVIYFKKHPKKFKLLVREYEQECSQLLNLSFSTKKPKDFSKLFNLYVSFWSKLSVIIELSTLIKKSSLKQIAQHAYNVRKKTEKVEYLSCNNLIKLVSQLLPHLSEFTDVLMFEEIINKNIPSEDELTKRGRGYIYFEDKLYTGLFIEQLEKQQNIEILQTKGHILRESQFLKGMPAMRGKVRGKVKVIFETAQLNKIKDGDILVAPMTTPDYVMAMKKVVAFVTDEGGITCHAAIVARELEKPCIVGTKIATQVLKDGDWVEVDANEGLVKILF